MLKFVLIMKKLLLAAVAVLTIFAGCKDKDKDEEIVTQIEIVEGETINMIIGESLKLHIKHYPEHLPAPKITEWKSSDVSVATAGFGEVQAKKEGETLIIATTANNIKATSRVIVSAIEIVEIKIDKTNCEVLVGGTLQLTPKVSPENASYKNDLVYTSTDENVAKVEKGGKVESISVGECQIKIASPDGKVTAICNLKVLPNEVSNISLNKSELNIEQGETFKFEVTIEPDIATDKTVTWVSSDESVATISADGALTSIGIGECTITANSSNDKVKAECKVKVSPASVKGLELSKTYAKILIGSTDVIAANVIPANAANKNVTWASSDETVATVDNGIVTGIAAGTVTITATTEDGGFNQICGVTVGGINIFMSAQNGSVVTTFSAGGVTSSIKCEITNNSNVDILVKECVAGGVHFSVGQTLYSGSYLKCDIPTQSTSVVWIIEYNGIGLIDKIGYKILVMI